MVPVVPLKLLGGQPGREDISLLENKKRKTIKQRNQENQ
jgi:hypothetical protein